MKILVINGSPAVEESHTLILTKAFIAGLERYGECDVSYFNVYQQKSLHACVGCYSCWTKTPGKCVFADDMPLAEYMAADMIIWSFPLYFFGVPSQAKCVIDRLLPTCSPLMEERDGGGTSHPARYDLSKQKYVLISTCGFADGVNNYEALIKQFEILYHGECKIITCAQGHLFKTEQVADRCNEYLAHVTQAGYEVAVDSDISTATAVQLAELLFPQEAFLEMANAEWEIEGDTSRGSKGLRLLKQMAAVYNPANYSGDLCIQLVYTDLDETYQLVIDHERCVVQDTDLSDSPQVTITTTYEVWKDISTDKLDGAKAMLEGLYKVDGDFNVMLQMSKLFSTKRESPTVESKKKTDMKVLLLPFIVLWMVLPISSFWGGVAATVISLLSLLLLLKNKFTVYDYCSIVAAIVIGLLGMSGVGEVLLPVSYIVFGVLWGFSCLLPVPLTAYYSINDYSAEYLNNPIFIQTNRILTGVWTAAYFIAAIGMYFMLDTALRPYSGVLIYPLFGLMAYFTNWFKDYYPAAVARGE